MKYYLVFMMLLVFSGLHAQVSEYFTDGDFTNNPPWLGDSAKFKIDTSRKQLRLDAPAIADEAFLSTFSESIENADWEFLVSLDFKPSSSNYADLYVVSDKADLKLALNGYFIRVGGSSQEVSLYRQDGNSKSEIIDGMNDLLDPSTNNVWIKLTRDSVGNWSLFSDTSGSSSYILVGTVFDDAYFSSSYAGVKCVYTKSRSSHFGFDDIVITGDPFVDDVQPKVENFLKVDRKTLTLDFSEPLDTTLALSAINYQISPGGILPSSVNFDTILPNRILLGFANELDDATLYSLGVDNVEDLAGNVMIPASFSFHFYEPVFKDVVINEFLPKADTNRSGLPNAEFIELFNQTAFPLNLAGWGISDAAKIASGSPASISDVTIESNAYLILCPSSFVSEFSTYGDVVGVSSWPSINNTTEDLQLTDRAGNVVDFIAFDDGWFGDDERGNGGFSLEMIDPDNPCQGEKNWVLAADSSGGTPGMINSVDMDVVDDIGPSLINVQLVKQSALSLFFDEDLDDDLSGLQVSLVEFSVSLDTFFFIGSKSHLTVHFKEVIPGNANYTVIVNGVGDCSGNPIEFNSLMFTAPAMDVLPGDLVINEVLTDPYKDGFDFIELYNLSDKIIDLNKIEVIEFNPETGLQQESGFVDTTGVLLYPNDFVVFTENPSNLSEHYDVRFPERIIPFDLPNFPNAEGIIVLNVDSVVIDSLSYSDDWHFALLDNTEGISLERIRFTDPTQSKDNWHSAAATDGFATPGYENSQQSDLPDISNEVLIVPEVFSPDQDGYKDFTTVFLKLNEPGFTANITVFDADGREIKKLVSNQLLGRESQYNWDGLNEDGEIARIGIYIVYVEVFNLQGEVKNFRKKVVLGSRFY